MFQELADHDKNAFHIITPFSEHFWLLFDHVGGALAGFWEVCPVDGPVTWSESLVLFSLTA